MPASTENKVPAVLSNLYADSSVPKDCSGFFKAVIKKLGITGLNGQANDIINTIDSTPGSWIKIGAGAKAGTEASKLAGQGYFVVAILKGAEHADHRANGHLAVVLSTTTSEGYPYVIGGGGKTGQSDGSKAVRGVWRTVDAPNVRYYRSTGTFDQLK